MRAARKQLSLAAIALAAVVFMLSVNDAAAQITVLGEEPEDNHACTNVSLNIHTVTGGCHYEIQSEHHISFVVQTGGGPIVITNCNWRLEAQVGGNGVGYVTAPSFTSEPGAMMCARKPCDEGAGGAKKPWPFSLTEVEAGNETIDLSLCFELFPDGGTGEVVCELHMPVTSPTEHTNEIGDSVPYACEAPLGAASFHTIHLIGETDSLEDIEIVH
jgi:hypothetical protein